MKRPPEPHQISESIPRCRHADEIDCERPRDELGVEQYFMRSPTRPAIPPANSCASANSTDTSWLTPFSAMVTPNRRSMRAIVTGLWVMATKRVSARLRMASRSNRSMPHFRQTAPLSACNCVNTGLTMWFNGILIALVKDLLTEGELWLFKAITSCMVASFLSGCGLVVPDMQRFPHVKDDEKFEEAILVKQIKCEIQTGNTGRDSLPSFSARQRQ